MKFEQKWKFAIEAYSGDGGFDDKSYIDRHTRESDDKYAERKKIAYYSNIFVQKIGRYNGYLFKEKPIRATNNKLIQQVLEDCDNAGNNINVFMSGFSKTAKVRGSGLILVDMPKSIPITQADQMNERALPYFVNIPPENVTGYKLDKFGKFDYIAYKDTIDQSTYSEEKIIDVVRYYDKSQWAIFSSKGVILDSGSYSIGVNPVLFMGENGVFPDIGEFTQVANIAKRHFNLESEMDEIMRGQTFNILTINADAPSDVAITLSTDNAIKYGKGMNAPSFIAPDVSPSETYKGKIQTLEERIDDITYDISTGLGAESGVALDIKFQGLNGSLSNFAMRLQDFETRLFEVVKKYINAQNAEVKIMYPETFEISDLEKEIGTLDKVKSMGYKIPTYEATKLKQIIGNDLNNISKEELALINTEIEDSLKEEID